MHVFFVFRSENSRLRYALEIVSKSSAKSDSIRPFMADLTFNVDKKPFVVNSRVINMPKVMCS